MTKFYIQSGDYRLVVQANTARGAAIWAVHRALSQVVSFGDDAAEQSVSTANDSSSGRLGDTVQVHEQGFDRADAKTYETFGVIHQWNQLLRALDRLHEDLERPALPR